MHNMIGAALTTETASWSSMGSGLDQKGQRTERFAELMFDALDQAFCALGHADPIGQLRYVAELRREGSDPTANSLEDQRIDLVAGFAAEILSAAARYAALLERLEASKVARPAQPTTRDLSFGAIQASIATSEGAIPTLDPNALAV